MKLTTKLGLLAATSLTSVLGFAGSAQAHEIGHINLPGISIALPGVVVSPPVIRPPVVVAPAPAPQVAYGTGFCQAYPGHPECREWRHERRERWERWERARWERARWEREQWEREQAYRHGPQPVPQYSYGYGHR